MKKLMIAAAAAAVGFGAFAYPEVYEYKAALKNMYLKEMPVTVKDSGVTYKTTVYMKYQKSTNLNGWLIMDQDGVTSPTIMTDLLGDSGYASPSTGYDFGRNRGFLVVINNGAYKEVKHPKILPAILDGKWIDTAFTKLGEATSGLAEGYLYVGGDAVKPVRPQLDYLASVDDIVTRSGTNELATAFDIPGHLPYPPVSAGVTNFTGLVAIADYVWTSVYLFSTPSKKEGYFNGPNWFVNAFNQFEGTWDDNLPELLQTGWVTNDNYYVKGKLNNKQLPDAYFHDTWMNGSGIGKWTRGTITTSLCCGADESVGNNDVVIDTLSGNVKGGLFLCTENGIVVASKNYGWFHVNPDVVIEWEDQFNTARISGIDAFFPLDGWQNDLWQDGFFEIETTDVIFGTWSIKRTTAKFFADDKSRQIASDTETTAFKNLMKKVSEATKSYLPTEYTTEEEDEDEQGAPTTKKYKYTNGSFAYNEALWSAIDGAAKNLLKADGSKANVFDGNEIYALNASKHHSGQFALPMVTPQFALFYRLVYASNFTKEEVQ